MVIRAPNASRRQRAVLTTELLIAIGILTTAVLPLAYGWQQERKLLRAHYHHAVVMQIVDGEMEILAAGEWRGVREGQQPYPVRAEAARNLPPGRFVLTRHGETLRLAWQPDKPDHGGKVVREIRLPATP